jgi:2'-5' RNA ligase
VKRLSDSRAGELIRAFLAVEAEGEVRAQLLEQIAVLRPGLPGARFATPAGLHLTLRFLGDSRPDQLVAFEAVVQRAAAQCPEGEAEVTGLGTFPESGGPRVLFVALALPPAVIELQRACEAAAVAAGFTPEARPFRAHVTLARWRERAQRPTLPAVRLARFPLSRATLFRSELLPSGAVYTVLASFPFGTEATATAPLPPARRPRTPSGN